jgi:hypothetical protein
MFFLTFNKLDNLLENKRLSNKKVIKINKTRPLVMVSEISFFIDNQFRKSVLLNLTDGIKEIKFVLDYSLNNLMNHNFGITVGTVITINSLIIDRKGEKKMQLSKVFKIVELSVLGIQQSDEDIRQSLYDFENLNERPTHKVEQIEPSLTNKCWSIEVEVLKKTAGRNLYGPRSMYLHLKDSSAQIIAKVVGDENVNRFNQLKENQKYIIRNAECPYKNKYLENIDILCTKHTHFIPSKTNYKKKDKLLYKFKNNPKLLKFYMKDNDYANNKDFCMLSQLCEKEVNTNVYVEAIIEEVGELSLTRNQLTMRNISIVDMSGLVVNVALFGEQAEKFSYRPGTMLLLINVIVNKFNAKYSLIVTRKSGMVEIEDYDGFRSSDRLRTWWVKTWWPFRHFRTLSRH